MKRFRHTRRKRRINGHIWTLGPRFLKMKLKIPLLLIFFTTIAFVVISRSFYSVKYALQRLPGRGFGLVATERINRGELIIRESPLISIKTQQSWFRPSDSYSSAKIDKIFNTLSQEDKLLYCALSYQVKHDCMYVHRDPELVPSYSNETSYQRHISHE